MNELQPQKHNDACLDMGLLVSMHDGELTAEETEHIQAHLVVCPDCAADERAMHTASQEVYTLLTLLEPSPSEIPETKLALSTLQARFDAQSRGEENDAAASSPAHIRFFQARKPQHRSRWWAAAVAAALVALLALPNAGALANQFLALFSVQRFQPVSVNPQNFRNGIGEDLQSFGDINIQSANLDNIQHPTQAQVERYLNFKLLLPGQLPPGIGHAVQFTLIDRVSGSFTFHAAQTRAYLAQTGQSSVSIPPQLDGATYTLTLAPGEVAMIEMIESDR